MYELEKIKTILIVFGGCLVVASIALLVLSGMKVLTLSTFEILSIIYTWISVSVFASDG